MIDEEWLDRTLHYKFASGERFEGVAGVGGSNIVLWYRDAAGKKLAMKMGREAFFFPSYIHEVPNWLAPTVQYDVARLNRKLHGLIGDLQVFVFVEAFNDLFTSIVEAFRDADVSELDSVTGPTADETRIIRFMFKTPVFAYQLDELETGDNPAQMRDWAVAARHSVERMGREDPDLRPAELLDNPLLVWGGAVLEGYFRMSEVPDAVVAINRAMEAAPDDLVVPFLHQADIVMGQLDRRDPESRRLPLLAALYDATGLFPWQFTLEGQEPPTDSPTSRIFVPDVRDTV